MYLALAAAHRGPILELAAGSGRIAVPLAAAGHDVTAVDRDADMLARLATRWDAERGGSDGSLQAVTADMTSVDLGERFALVVLGLNSLLLVDGRDAQRRVADAVARHVEPGGRAVIDVWLPSPEDLALYDGRLVLDWTRRDSETGEWVAKSSSARYEPALGRATITTFFDAWRAGEPPRRHMRTDSVSFLNASEIISIVEATRLRVELVAGDYSMSELSPGSDRVVVVGRSVAR